MRDQIERRNIALVINLANQFLQQIFEAHNSLHETVFIDDNCKMVTFLAQRGDAIGQGLSVRNEIRRTGEVSQTDFFITRNQWSKYVANVKYTDNFVRIIVMQRNTAKG